MTGAEPAAAPLLSLRLSLFYVTFFLFVGINMPFWPLWLAEHGLDAGEIGVLLAAPMWIRVVANPLLARLADRRGETRRPLLFLIGAATLFYLLFAVTEGFWPIFAVTLAATALLSAVMPLGDSLTMHAALKGHVQYGRVRLWGSIAFIVAATGGGIVLAGRSADLILHGLVLSLILTFAAVLWLPDWRRSGPAAGHGGVAALVGDRRFLLFLVAASLIQASHSVLYGFSTLHWQAAGLTKPTIGWLWAESTVAEILLFAVGTAVLRRIDGVRLLVFAGAAGVVRWLALGASTDLPVLVTVQVLHGLTFGAAHLAAMDFIARSAPPGLAATAQSLYSAVALGGMFGITMLAAGGLYAGFGGGAFFAMAGLALAGTVVAAHLAWRSAQPKAIA